MRLQVALKVRETVINSAFSSLKLVGRRFAETSG